MTFSLLNPAITDKLVSAICNTLVHSVWQGLLLAAVAGLIIIGTKRTSPALRYNLLIAALLLFTAGVAATFASQLGIGRANQISQLAGYPQVLNVAAHAGYQSHRSVESGGLSGSLLGYLESHHNTIVLIWFLIICAKSVQLATGLYGTYRLKNTNIVTAGNVWQNRMLQLAALLGVKQGVKLLESGLAKVPMVVGHLKPVILIPLGLLTSLSAGEVEAILIHELAHIKRRDYLVNLLQSLVEIVFFFNPAVLWISQLIKTERENCCDDLALAQSSDKINYIRALVSCEQYQAAVPAYAMAFPGNKNSLLNRVKRMADNRNHSLNVFEKTVLAICLVLSGVCMSAFAARENIKRTVHAVVKAMHHELNAVEQHELIKQTQLLQKQTEQIRKNTALLNQSKPQLRATEDTDKRIPVNVQLNPSNLSVQPNVNLNTSVALSPMNVHLSPMNVTLSPLVGLDTNLKVKIKAVVKDTVKVQVKYYNNYSTKTVNTQTGKTTYMSYSYKNGKRYVDSNIRNYKEYSDTTYKVAPKAPIAPRAPIAPKAPIMPKAPTAPTAPIAPKAPKAPVAPRLTPDIGDELLKAHLITDKSNFTVKLTNSELIVNGVKQSEENHQLLLQKYMKKPGQKVNLTVNTTTTKD